MAHGEQVFKVETQSDEMSILSFILPKFHQLKMKNGEMSTKIPLSPKGYQIDFYMPEFKTHQYSVCHMTGISNKSSVNEKLEPADVWHFAFKK